MPYLIALHKTALKKDFNVFRLTDLKLSSSHTARPSRRAHGILCVSSVPFYLLGTG